jgi:hypothetical protein
MIKIQFFNASKVQRKIIDISKNQLKGFENSMNKAVVFLDSEVRASINGQRAEKRSYKSGNFLGHVDRGVNSKSNVITGMVWNNTVYGYWLETGKRNNKQLMLPRKHFEQSLIRNKVRIVDFLEKSMKANI